MPKRIQVFYFGDAAEIFQILFGIFGLFMFLSSLSLISHEYQFSHSALKTKGEIVDVVQRTARTETRNGIMHATYAYKISYFDQNHNKRIFESKNAVEGNDLIPIGSIINILYDHNSGEAELDNKYDGWTGPVFLLFLGSFCMLICIVGQTYAYRKRHKINQSDI